MTMAAVRVTHINISPNPAGFLEPLKLEVLFEVLAPLSDVLEFTISYVASPEDDSKDIELDSLCVGPLKMGPSRIEFSVDPPAVALIPREDLLGVTVILFSCRYLEQEFLRIGYFVNTEYSSPLLNEAPPDPPLPETLTRTILSDQPRVTRIPIDWRGLPSTTTTDSSASASASSSSSSSSTTTSFPLPLDDDELIQSMEQEPSDDEGDEDEEEEEEEEEDEDEDEDEDPNAEIDL